MEARSTWISLQNSTDSDVSGEERGDSDARERMKR